MFGSSVAQQSALISVHRNPYAHTLFSFHTCWFQIGRRSILNGLLQIDNLVKIKSLSDKHMILRGSSLSFDLG